MPQPLFSRGAGKHTKLHVGRLSLSMSSWAQAVAARVRAKVVMSFILNNREGGLSG